MRLKHLRAIRCEWRNANTMSRGRISGKSGTRTVCVLCPWANVCRARCEYFPFFFFHQAEPSIYRRCGYGIAASGIPAGVLRTGHAHASAKNRGSPGSPSYEAFGQVFHGITLFIDRQPPIFILRSQIPLILEREKKCFRVVFFFFRKRSFFVDDRRIVASFNGYFHARHRANDSILFLFFKKRKIRMDNCSSLGIWFLLE